MNRYFTLAAVALLALIFSSNTSAQAAPCYRWGWGNHPLRHEVLRRDNRLGNELRYDRGYLGGHYGQLAGEDRAIRRQEIGDSMANGGYLTRGEYRQLNREENTLQRQVNHDYRW